MVRILTINTRRHAEDLNPGNKVRKKESNTLDTKK